jgi:hypothetical protein
MRTRLTRPRGILSGLLAVSTLSACTSWHTQPLAEVIAKPQSHDVRVDRADGTRLVIVKPQATADSLVGTSGGKPAGVALTDIRQIAVRRSDGTKTGILILGGVVLVVGTIVFLDEVGKLNEN